MFLGKQQTFVHCGQHEMNNLSKGTLFYIYILPSNTTDHS